jgi:N-acetylglucosaminyldiphosphoundecaprenol N-acetyl-beta-D-mannosaminyltransferase
MLDVRKSQNTDNYRRKVSAFSCELDPLTKIEAIDAIFSWIRSDGACKYVVTPNMHHLVLLRRQALLRDAYRHASLALVDGRPVTWILKLLRNAVPEVVPGSDLVPALFAAATPEQPISVFLLGAAPGVAEKARAVIKQRWPQVRVVGVYSPPPRFEYDDAELAHIVELLRVAAPDLLVIGFGCPKQEIWIRRFAGQINAKVAICAGATIDFIAGHRQRAPMWMRRIGLEWLFRAVSEPLLLGPRYVMDACVLPLLVVESLLERRRALREKEAREARRPTSAARVP